MSNGWYTLLYSFSSCTHVLLASCWRPALVTRQPCSKCTVDLIKCGWGKARGKMSFQARSAVLWNNRANTCSDSVFCIWTSFRLDEDHFVQLFKLSTHPSIVCNCYIPFFMGLWGVFVGANSSCLWARPGYTLDKSPAQQRAVFKLLR